MPRENFSRATQEFLDSEAGHAFVLRLARIKLAQIREQVVWLEKAIADLEADHADMTRDAA